MRIVKARTVRLVVPLSLTRKMSAEPKLNRITKNKKTTMILTNISTQTYIIAFSLQARDK